MPSRSPLGALEDIRRNIELAQAFVEGLAFEQFCLDRRTAYAVIRCLEIISEASRKLPEDLKARHPQIPWIDLPPQEMSTAMSMRTSSIRSSGELSNTALSRCAMSLRRNSRP